MSVVTIHDQAYQYYTWQQLGDYIFEIAEQIIKSGQEFDRVIALAKGGLTFARSLVDYLNIKDISTLQVEFYTGIGETDKAPVITQSLPVSVRGERILVFDDIADSGGTLEVATQYLKYHAVKSITTAVLVKKPWSRFKVEYAATTSDAWVIFPNEARETIQYLELKWRSLGDTSEEIRSQLLQIGFNQSEVALFTNLD